MSRVVKDAEERRAELLDAALALFLKHGYDATSVDQITGAVGVAKGTFYHYFDGKQELLGELSQRFGDELFDQLEAALAAVPGNALDRLRAFVTISMQLKVGRLDESMEIARSLYSAENVALRTRLIETWVERTRPLLAGIVEQGASEGAFRVHDVRAATDIVLSLLYDYGVRIGMQLLQAPTLAENISAVARSLDALESAWERVLGLGDGELQLGLADGLRLLKAETAETAG